MRKAFAAVLAPCLVRLGNEALTAENDPTHAPTMIVPFPAGGATDTVAAILVGEYGRFSAKASSSRNTASPRTRLA